MSICVYVCLPMGPLALHIQTLCVWVEAGSVVYGVTSYSLLEGCMSWDGTEEEADRAKVRAHVHLTWASDQVTKVGSSTLLSFPQIPEGRREK